MPLRGASRPRRPLAVVGAAALLATIWLVGARHARGQPHTAEHVPPAGPETAVTDPAAPTCREMLENGGFEDGPAVGWLLESDATDPRTGRRLGLRDVVLSDADIGEETAAEGEWVARLGGGPDYEMWLIGRRPVWMVPEDELVTATLRYAFAYDTNELPGGSPSDLFAAYLIDDAGRRAQIEGTGFSEDEGLPTRVWLEIEADVTELFVSTVPDAWRRVAFYSANDTYDHTTHLVDAVSLEMCVPTDATATPTATAAVPTQPTAAPTSTPTASPTAGSPRLYLPRLAGKAADA